MITTNQPTDSSANYGGRAVIQTDTYINKLSGEQIERACRMSIDRGCNEVELDFSNTEIVNSIGISILLGVIDTASTKGAKVVFTKVNEETVELFDMLGLTGHVTIE